MRDHSQGVFEIAETPLGRSAVSQAAGHPLMPDAAGRTQPPGGGAGLPLDQLMAEVKSLAGAGPEAQR